MRFKKILPWILLIIIHAGFIFWGFSYGRIYTKDSYEYLAQAYNLLHHFTFYSNDLNEPYNPLYISLRPPGYGFFLAMTTWPGTGLIITCSIQIALSILSIYFSKRIFELISGKTVSDWFYLLPLTAFLPQFIFAGMIMSEILLQFLIILLIYAGVRYHHSNKFKWVIIFQVVITLAMLVKPVMWLFPLLALPVAFLMVVRKGYSIRLLVTFLIPFFVIAGMHYRNYKLTGVGEYTSISRKLLINYNIQALLEQEYGRIESLRILDSLQNAVAAKSYKDRSHEIDQFSYTLIRQHPVNYFFLHCKGVLRFFIDTGRWELNHYFNSSTNADGSKNEGNGKSINLPYEIYCIIFNVILAAGLFVFVFNKKIDYRDRRIIAGVILYCAILTGPSASARFRIPLFPLQLICWGILITEIDRRHRSNLQIG